MPLSLGAAPSARHHSPLSSYRLNLWRGPKVVCGLIVSDIRTILDLGASRRAADLLLVLREFLSDYPEASLAPTGKMPRSSPRGAFLLKSRALIQFNDSAPEKGCSLERLPAFAQIRVGESGPSPIPAEHNP